MRVLVVAALLFSTAPAMAISNHVVKAGPKVVRKQGKPVAWRVNVVLKSAGLARARIGLGWTSVSGPLRGDPGRVRALLDNEDKAFIALRLDEHVGLAGTPQKEVELTIPWDKFKPGDQLDVWTAWRNDGDAKPIHFFGVFQGTGVTTITLPAADAK